jgi:hypothetical protein
MGMYDTVIVNKKFLPNILELKKHNYVIETLQTKCLANLLETYIIDENGLLHHDDVEFDFVENKNFKKGGWNPPFFLEEKSRNTVFLPYTGTIEAYEYFSDFKQEKDSVWISLTFKFVDGILQGLPLLSELKVDNIENIKKRNLEHNLIMQKRKKDPVYKLTRFLWRMLSIVITKLCKVQGLLMKYEAR